MNVQKIRNFLGGKKTEAARSLGLIPNNWEKALPEEALFWRNALENPSTHWVQSEFDQRTNPEFPFQMEFRQLIHSNGESVVKILDVGAGPLTRIGKIWPGHQLEITATDPLAESYEQLLNDIALVPLVKTQNCLGEELAEKFSPDFFDFSYSSNALDHSREPVVVIQQMLKVTKPLGSLYLWHFANCGIGERYKGLHQWNFDRDGSDLLISDGRSSTFLQPILGDTATVKCHDDTAFGSRVVVAVITKAAQ